VLAPIGRHKQPAAGPGDLSVNLIVQTAGLEKRLFGEHIPTMATIVQCNCGAEYRRTEEKFLEPHTGDAVCAVCGAALVGKHPRSHVRTYRTSGQKAGMTSPPNALGGANQFAKSIY